MTSKLAVPIVVIIENNLYGTGIDSFIPIVVPRQCSILGIGRITDTCVPDNGNIMV
ncbi:MAG: 2-oxo acid dehydrogenase subunit E2 [Phycisphaerae bacterium]